MQDDKPQEQPGADAGKEPLAKAVPAATYTPTPSSGFSTSTGYGPKHVTVSFGPKSGPFTPDEVLWTEIQRRSSAISFAEYAAFIDSLLLDPVQQGSGFQNFQGVDAAGDPVPSVRSDSGLKLQASLRRQLYGPDAYLLLQVATECFLMSKACTGSSDFENSSYLVSLPQGKVLPFLDIIRQRLAAPVGGPNRLTLGTNDGVSISNSRLVEPCFLELIWSYWHEQGMLVQTINAVAIRYQNIRMTEGIDPLASFELDSLRPLNNILWGYLQHEPYRLSVLRRAYEYDHHYGLRLEGRAVPELRTADTRAKFIAAFHELMYQAYVFYKDDDIATVQADPFPVLNALRELHFVLGESMHNQFGDLPTQARAEMLVQQWLLSRPEIREFLRGRAGVPYPEPWMDCVDTMKTLQGWTDVPSLYFNELAVTGEALLLSVRYADWATQTVTSTDSAANWARNFRSFVQRYAYAYRMATGVDLFVDRVELQSSFARHAQPPIRGRAGAPRHFVGRPPMDQTPSDLPPMPAPRALPAPTMTPDTAATFDRSRRI